jgi:ATP-dependent RNA helicase DeaD
LWQAEARTGGQAVGRTEGAAGAAAQVWVGIGKRDGVTPNDLVAVLTREAGVPRAGIGRIELRESFALIQVVPPAEPEAVAAALAGKTIKKRRLAARVDRGRPVSGER